MVIAGAVHTALLRNSRGVSPQRARQILAFIDGAPVTVSAHPRARAVSPRLLTGVDCEIRTHTGRRPRGVGTVVSHGVLTGGHIAQGSAWTTVAAEPTARRLPWSFYMGVPGTLHLIGRIDPRDLDGHVSTGAGALDLGIAAEERIRVMQRHPSLDTAVPIRVKRTTLRWHVGADRDAPIRIGFTDTADGHRADVLLPTGDATPDAYAAMAEEIALRHWLMTTLTDIVQQGILSTDRDERLRRLAPVLDHLAHLWPTTATHLDPCLTGMVRTIDDRVGMTVQWRATIDRVRDQFALASVAPSPR
jgi:hypothetical protein